VTIDSRVIGGRLKAVRVSLGFTQEQVAKYLGTKREIISYIETGTRSINTVTLQKLADLYGYRLSYFIDEKILDKAPAVSMAFRVHDLSDKDLTTIAQVKIIAMNLDQLYALLEE